MSEFAGTKRSSTRHEPAGAPSRGSVVTHINEAAAASSFQMLRKGAASWRLVVLSSHHFQDQRRNPVAHVDCRDRFNGGKETYGSVST